MTIDQQIKAALEPFGWPVANAVYSGKEPRYFVFNYTSIGADFADDAPSHELYLVQVHLYAPLGENISQKIAGVKRALLEAGLTWPETENASDEEGRHIVFECEAAGEAALYG